MKAVRDLHSELLLLNTKSSIKPCAQNNIQCAAVSVDGSMIMQKVQELYNDKTLSLELKAIVELMVISGCRVSQALQINYKNISKNGQIKIVGSKNGLDIVVMPSKYKEFWASYRRASINFQSIYSRFALYRLFKQYGIYSKVGNSSKYSVCHSLRHELASDIATITNDKNIIANKLGHKSTNTQKFYIHNEK